MFTFLIPRWGDKIVNSVCRYPLLNTRYAEGLIQGQGQQQLPIQTQVRWTWNHKLDLWIHTPIAYFRIGPWLSPGGLCCITISVSSIRGCFRISGNQWASRHFINQNIKCWPWLCFLQLCVFWQYQIGFYESLAHKSWALKGQYCIVVTLIAAWLPCVRLRCGHLCAPGSAAAHHPPAGGGPHPHKEEEPVKWKGFTHPVRQIWLTELKFEAFCCSLCSLLLWLYWSELQCAKYMSCHIILGITTAGLQIWTTWREEKQGRKTMK